MKQDQRSKPTINPFLFASFLLQSFLILSLLSGLSVCLSQEVLAADAVDAAEGGVEAIGADAARGGIAEAAGIDKAEAESVENTEKVDGVSTDEDKLEEVAEDSSSGADDNNDAPTSIEQEFEELLDMLEEEKEAAATGDASIGSSKDPSTAEVQSSQTSQSAAAPATNESQDSTSSQEPTETPHQSGPLIDLFGPTLLSLSMVDETHAQIHQHPTNEILSGKKVIGLYFSADWCGPCRQFTPDLVSFYEKINGRRGREDQFEIIWISRCRTIDAFGQYFTHMKWLALPPNEAMGTRGQLLGEKYKVKSIPTLVLLDELGDVITLDGRNKIPMDKAGIGFPWKSPLRVIWEGLVPRSARVMVKDVVGGMVQVVKGVLLGRGKS